MYYTIYKITNQIDGKFYIGSHKTKNLNDNYMGSGKYLRYAQEKHGIENFTKEILYIFNTPEEMYQKEAEIVNENYLETNNTYNLKIGGFGGWDHINSDEEFRKEKNRKAMRIAIEKGSLLEKANERHFIKQREYDENPKLCANCSEILSYKQRSNKFCCRSCSTSFNNKYRQLV